MNLTLAVDEKVVEKARQAARSMGTSLNQVIRDFLEELAGERPAADDIRELKRLSAKAKGRSRGWKFNREEIHERS